MIKIKNRLRNCCENCVYIDLDIETVETTDMECNKSMCINIACTHTDVCGMYLKDNEDERKNNEVVE